MYLDTMYDHHGDDHMSMIISMIISMMRRWNFDDGVDGLSIECRWCVDDDVTI